MGCRIPRGESYWVWTAVQQAVGDGNGAKDIFPVAFCRVGNMKKNVDFWRRQLAPASPRMPYSIFHGIKKTSTRKMLNIPPTSPSLGSFLWKKSLLLLSRILIIDSDALTFTLRPEFRSLLRECPKYLDARNVHIWEQCFVYLNPPLWVFSLGNNDLCKFSLGAVSSAVRTAI